MTILSIIIPCYNSEKTLERTLNSIEYKTNTLSKIEIIIINDGSEDNTLKISNAFFKNKKILYKIFSQKNLGLSIARNKGLSIASGKYVWFVDSDDCLIKKNFSLLINQISQKELFDYISFNILFNHKGRKKLVSNNSKDHKKKLIGAQYYIYNKEFLLKKKLFFIKNLIHEDLEFLPSVFFFSNKNLHLNSTLYEHIYTQNSITNSRITIKRVHSLVKVALLNFDNFKLSKNNLIYGHFALIALNSAARYSLKLDKKDFKIFIRYLRIFNSNITKLKRIKTNYISKIKLILVLSYFSLIRKSYLIIKR